MINGRVYWLDVQDVTNGNVTADISSGIISSATWDGVGTPLLAGKLSFIRVAGDLKQQLEGWLFQYSEKDPLWRMAGTIEHISGDHEARSGWYGTLDRDS